MFYENGITGLHIEPTSKCNAKCPQCPRNVYGSNHLLHGLTEEDFPIELLDQIDLPVLNDVLVNGNYGDIVMHSKPKEFIDALVSKWGAKRDKPTVRIHSNGGGLPNSFWKHIGSLKLNVEFGIDGVTNEQHQLYRQNTRLDIVLKNAQTFIDAGGEALWAMTLFKHNQNDVSTAEQIAKDMGFKSFRSRPSTRFSHFSAGGEPIGAVLNDDFSVKHWLQPINGKEITADLNGLSKNIQRKFQMESLKGNIISRSDHVAFINDKVTCEVKESSRVYVSARGRVTPCCYLERIQKWDKDCELIGIDPNFNSLHNNKMSYILKHEFWDILDNSIANKKVLSTCSYSCGKGFSGLKSRIQKEYNAI